MSTTSGTISKQQLLLTLLGTSLVSLYLFSFMAFQTDSPSFINAVELLLGESTAPDRLFRLSKPLSLGIPAFLYHFFALPISDGFLVQQILAYWLGALALYKVIAFISPKESLAYVGMLAYILCQPMAVYGLAVLTDGLGWCWMLWGLLFSLKIIDASRLSLFQLGLLGCFMGLGFFIKESIVITGMCTFFLVLLHPSHTFKSKLIAYSVIGLSFLATFILGNYLLDAFWGISILDWIKFGQSDPPPFYWKSFITQSYHTIDLFWFFFLIGLAKDISLRNWSYIRYALFLTLISGWVLLPFFWPYLYDRILFMMVPFMVLWIALGAMHFKSFSILLVLLAGLLNLLVTFFIYKHQISGLIISSAFLFGILLLLTHYIGSMRSSK